MGIIDELKDIFNMSESKRRSRLGVGVAKWAEEQAWYFSNLLSSAVEQPLPETLYGIGRITRKNPFALLRRSKEFLAMRSIDDLPPAIRDWLDQRYPWNKEQRSAKTLLDLFTALKHSYSSLLPIAHRSGNVDLVVSEQGKARVPELARSHSIWLDPVDAPKELYKYRLRIQDCITWGYDSGFVPVMMTLTVFHRWHECKRLLRVIKKAWSSMFSGSKWRRFAERAGLEDYIRRLEITINDGNNVSSPIPSRLNCSESMKNRGTRTPDDNNYQLATNAGWHPHFHAIWFVPKDKLEVLSDMEEELRDAWVCCVRKQFKKEFGEDIDESYLPAFRNHGLWFSRYKSGPFKGQLRPVSDGSYLAKIMGYDSAHVFGGDSEMTDSTLKDSKIPFDLLLEVTASNVDLFCEYAIATKGVAAFTFSKGLQDKVDAYLELFPSKRASKFTQQRPAEKLVATIRRDVYQFIQRNSLYPMLLKKISEGYDALCSWLKQVYVDFGVPDLCDCPFAMPRPPT